MMDIKEDFCDEPQVELDCQSRIPCNSTFYVLHRYQSWKKETTWWSTPDPASIYFTPSTLPIKIGAKIRFPPKW